MRAVAHPATDATGRGVGRAGALLGLTLLLTVSGCASVPDLPAAKRGVTAYVESGGYQRDVEKVVTRARRHLERRLGVVERPAIVLDIDETSLSNLDYVMAMDFGFTRPSWSDWVEQAKAPAVEPTRELVDFAHRQGVAVFYVTGRRESLREATERNLRRAGYDGWTRLYMKPEAYDRPSAGPYKTAARREITEEGFTILVNLGDQPSDLVGGFAEKNFRVPNPFY